MKKILAIAFLFSCLHVAGQEAAKVLPGFNRIRLGNRYDTGVINFLSPDTASALNIIGRLRVTDTTEHDARASYSSNLGASFTRYSLVDKNYTDSSISAHATTSSVLYSQIANGTALTSTTATNLLTSTVTVGANTLQVGQTLSYHGFFVLSTASSSIGTFTISPSVGGTQLVGWGPTLPTSASNTVVEYWAELTILTTGGGGSASLTMTFDPTGGSKTRYSSAALSTTQSINTTASNTFGLVAQWGTGSINSIQAIPTFTVKLQ